MSARAAALVAGWDPARAVDHSDVRREPRRRSARATAPQDAPCGACDGSGLVYGPPRGTVARDIAVCSACAGTGSEPDA